MTQLTRRSLFATAAALGAGSALAPLMGSSAFAAAPVVGKQNAGWYRYKIGNFEVTVVTDGVTNAPLPDTYIANAPKDAVAAALAAEFRPTDRAIQPYTPIVVNTGAKLVAIDTGLGLGVFQQSKGAVGQYHSNLQAAGIDRNAVDVVIISHFHGDHINGLVGPENKPAFPNAEVMVPAAEWSFWGDDANSSRVPEQIKGTFGNVKRVFGVLNNKVTQYEPGKELVTGITRGREPGSYPRSRLACHRFRKRQAAGAGGHHRRHGDPDPAEPGLADVVRGQKSHSLQSSAWCIKTGRGKKK